MRVSFYSYLEWLLVWVWDFLVPSFCAICRSLISSHYLCTECLDKIAPGLLLERKGYRLVSLSTYTEPLRSLILAKHHGDRWASRILGRLMVDRLALSWNKYAAVIPIPLHWSRYAERGFNQAEEIAGEISHQAGISYQPLLIRKRRTAYQTSLDKKGRLHNVENAFSFVQDKKELAKLFKDTHLLLIDDLYTTGATVEEAVKILRSLHPASITVAVAARVL